MTEINGTTKSQGPGLEISEKYCLQFWFGTWSGVPLRCRETPGRVGGEAP